MIMFWKEPHLVAGRSEPRGGGTVLEAHAPCQSAKSRGGNKGRRLLSNPPLSQFWPPRTGLDPVKRTLLTPHCPLWFFLSLNLQMICVYKISDRQLNRWIQICIACVYKPFVCSNVHENPFRHIFSDSSQNIDLTSVANASLV